MHWLNEHGLDESRYTSDILFIPLLNEYSKKYYTSLTIHIRRESRVDTLIRRV